MDHSQVSAVKYHHVSSRFDAPFWHDTINFVSTLSFVGNNRLCWLLNSVCTTFAGHQWNAGNQVMHQQNHPMRLTELLTTWTNKYALAADHLLGCLGNSSPILVTHVDALGIKRLSLITRCRMQQAHNTLSIDGNQPSSTLLINLILGNMTTKRCLPKQTQRKRTIKRVEETMATTMMLCFLNLSLLPPFLRKK